MPSMRKYHFIVNPISGNANNRKYAENLIRMLTTRHGASCQMHVLSARGEAEPYARQLAQTIDNDTTVVSVGGDGTFNEIASGLINTPTRIAIIPRGSGNGLSRMLRLPNHPKEQIDYLISEKTVRIDAGRFGQRNFFCTAGFGFEASIAFLFDKTGRKKRGPQQYVHHILREVFTYKPVDVELTLDGEKIHDKFFSVCFANADQYGNNAIIAPEASLTDGLFHVILVRPFPLIAAGTMGAALMGGYFDKLSYVETRKVKHASLKVIDDARFHCDGEPIRHETPLQIDLMHQVLNVQVPSDYDESLSPRLVNELNQKIETANLELTQALRYQTDRLSRQANHVADQAVKQASKVVNQASRKAEKAAEQVTQVRGEISKTANQLIHKLFSKKD